MILMNINQFMQVKLVYASSNGVIFLNKVGNYEYKILSHLKDGRKHSYGNISTTLPSINASTLVDNLKRLLRSESIKKEKAMVNGKSKKLYKITKIGLDKYRILKTLEEGIVYPPQTIPFESDRERIIWFLNTNEFCRWKHFKDERLGTQTGSLNRLLERLRQNRIIEKQITVELSRPIYRILPKGRDQFTLLLKKYNIDKEIVQRENINRIKRIVEETRDFVDKIDVDNEEVLLRFFKYVELLRNENLQEICNTNEHYYAILLFLAFNHPYLYPKYVAIPIFSKKFSINEYTLHHYLDFLNKPELEKYFVKIAVPSGNKEYPYYFLKEGKLSQRLESIIEEYVEQSIFRNALKGKEIALDDAFLTELDIRSLNAIVFEQYKVLPIGLKSADFVKTYLDQLSPQYGLKESLLSVDVLVKDLSRRKTKRTVKIPPKDIEKILSKRNSEDTNKTS